MAPILGIMETTKRRKTTELKAADMTDIQFEKTGEPQGSPEGLRRDREQPPTPLGKISDSRIPPSGSGARSPIQNHCSPKEGRVMTAAAQKQLARAKLVVMAMLALLPLAYIESFVQGIVR